MKPDNTYQDPFPNEGIDAALVDVDCLFVVWMIDEGWTGQGPCYEIFERKAGFLQAFE